MEQYIRHNIYGEILIPLENNYKIKSDFVKLNHKSPIKISSLKDIFQNDYKSFRSTVFKNELLHFYLAIKLYDADSNNPEEEKDSTETKKKSNLLNIKELNSYIENHCNINIQYNQVEIYGKRNSISEPPKIQKITDEISFSIDENKDKVNYINNGQLVKNEIIEDENIIIYEIFSQIKINENTSKKKENLSKSKIEMNITITTKKNEISYKDMDINDIYILNITNSINNKSSKVDDDFANKKYLLLNLTKKLTLTNPILFYPIEQFDCGNNKYILTLKIENTTNAINFIDSSIKNSLFLKKCNDEEEEKEPFLFNEFPITITDIFINSDKTSIDDLIFVNLLKLKQERKINNEIIINSKKLKFNLVNNKFPIVIYPKEIFNLIINIEKNYDYLVINENSFTTNTSMTQNKNEKEKNKGKDKDKDKDKEYDLVKLSLNTPICINILSNEPINNFIWSFGLSWKDEINNKLNVCFNIDSNNKDNIKLYKFFKVNFSIMKQNNKNVKYRFEFKNSFNMFDIKNHKDYDGLPDILPENPTNEIEMGEKENSKNFSMRYIPVRKGYVNFPPFEIYDYLLNKKYFVFFTTKIFVKEEEKPAE